MSEIGNGWYALAGNATDRNTAGDLLVHATATGADPADDFGDATLGPRGLDGAPFIVATDLFMTATSRRANVLLPASASASLPVIRRAKAWIRG